MAEKLTFACSAFSLSQLGIVQFFLTERCSSILRYAGKSTSTSVTVKCHVCDHCGENTSLFLGVCNFYE